MTLGKTVEWLVILLAFQAFCSLFLGQPIFG